MKKRETIDVIGRYAFFMEGVATLVTNTLEVLHLSGERWDMSVFMQFIDSAPQNRIDLGEPDWQKRMCNQRLKAAFERTNGSKRCQELMDYFLAYLPNRSYAANDMLHDAVVGVITGLRRSKNFVGSEYFDDTTE